MEPQEDTYLDHDEAGGDEDESFFAGWQEVDKEPLREGQRADSGYLWKRGAHNTGWKMRYFVFEGDLLRGARLAYYADDTLRRRQGFIDLASVRILDAPSDPRGEVHEQTGQGYELLLHTKQGRVWHLKASTRRIRDAWGRRVAASVGLPYVEVGPTSDEATRQQASLDFRAAMTKRQRIYVQAVAVGWARKEEPDKPGQFTAFEVRVRTNASFLFDDQTEFSVFRRFTDFSDLAAHLVPYRKPGMGEAPFIPPRHYKKRFSGALLEERRQAFDALLRFWINSEDFVAGLPLPLLRFLEPPPDADFFANPAGTVPVVREMEPTTVAKLPPLLRFPEGAAPFAQRLEALQMYLQHHRGGVSPLLAAQIVESVGGLSSRQRLQVAELMASFVEPERLFLITQHMPSMDHQVLVQELK